MGSTVEEETWHDCADNDEGFNNEPFCDRCGLRPLLKVFVCEVCDYYVLCTGCHGRRLHFRPPVHPFSSEQKNSTQCSEDENEDTEDETVKDRDEVSEAPRADAEVKRASALTDSEAASESRSRSSRGTHEGVSAAKTSRGRTVFWKE